MGIRSYKSRIAIVALAAVLASACGSAYQGRYRAAVAKNQRDLQRLELGMPVGEVRSLMGEGEVIRYRRIYFVDPWRSESFALVDGTEVLILYYVTQPTRKYYSAEDHELTPIVLENDHVVGWGWPYLRRSLDRYQVSAPKEQQ